MHWLGFLAVFFFADIAKHITIGAQSIPGDDTGEGLKSKTLDWLFLDRGPFHLSREHSQFFERYRQGYNVRYKIYREFARWRVSNLAVEQRPDTPPAPMPLAPEFVRALQELGRRPGQAQLLEGFIRKYGTHYVVTGTLGGEEALTVYVDGGRLGRRGENGSQSLEAIQQLAASYFIDREGTLRRLHEIQIAGGTIKVSEMRTGPLGCSSYENLDSVNSVLIRSPDHKIQLQGLQEILPEYLRERFVRAALSYLLCEAQGEYICHRGDCRCHCAANFPDCACPRADLLALEESLFRLGHSWQQSQEDFEQSDELRAFTRSLPTEHFLNASSIHQLWRKDESLQMRFRKLQQQSATLLEKMKTSARKLFRSSHHCHHNPTVQLPGPRSLYYWLNYVQSFLYCSENGLSGHFVQPSRACQCPKAVLPGPEVGCQRPLDCLSGTQCGGCPDTWRGDQCTSTGAEAEAVERFVSFEAPELDLQDSEVEDLLFEQDPRLMLPARFISNDMRIGTWFDPRYRHRILVTLKSNKYRPNFLHVLLGLELQLCHTYNSSLEPLMAVYVNPFGGSHSESWYVPLGQDVWPLLGSPTENSTFPIWDVKPTDSSTAECYNYSLRFGPRWKTLFETVHVYLRSQLHNESDGLNVPPSVPPPPPVGPPQDFMKVTSLTAYGYSLHFDPEAMRELVRWTNRPGGRRGPSETSRALQLLADIRDRINGLGPPHSNPDAPRVDLFTCFARHRLRLSLSEMVRVNSALQAFARRQPSASEFKTIPLC
uniref:BMP/retinoic acid inducible neural specific 2 n=1 Tax=Eptatretus burgeri TaxID=7764 RepID=A0A8C4QGP8_EPTBU